jgi:NADP-dependent 3-hydroxy acid dehydrogenase YdfG
MTASRCAHETTLPRSLMKTAIIIGASSGIGRALAIVLSREGYRLGLVARRTELLAQLQAELNGPGSIKTIDVSRPELAMRFLQELIDELQDVELFVVSAGVRLELPSRPQVSLPQVKAVDRRHRRATGLRRHAHGGGQSILDGLA